MKKDLEIQNCYFVQNNIIMLALFWSVKYIKNPYALKKDLELWNDYLV